MPATTTKKTRTKKLMRQSAKEKRYPMIGTFREKMAKLVQHAQKHAEMTRTDAWQDLYYKRAKADRLTRREFHDELVNFANNLEDTEQIRIVKDLKPLSDVKSELRDHIIEMQSWREKVVTPIASIPDDAAKLIADFRSRAKSEEQANALHLNGLADAMERAISEAPEIAWNDKQGVLTVTERDVA